MKKRELFVFAGQSNMMGAASLPPIHIPKTVESFEYLHQPRRMGAGQGAWRKAGYPCGEFSYIDLNAAYPNGEEKSELANFRVNTHFCPSMCNVKNAMAKTTRGFSQYSELNNLPGASIAPLFAVHWEQYGYKCAYAHLAKGGVPIAHYFDKEMRAEFLRRTGEEIYCNDIVTEGAAAYFDQKCTDFFADAAVKFQEDDLSFKGFVWLQGESGLVQAHHYETALDILWEKCKKLGFTHFLMIRVDFFGKEKITEVMAAQERFCAKHEDAYMMTRAASFLPFAGRDESRWFVTPPGEEYQNCRDSFFGFNNQHINEKGCELIARKLAENTRRLRHGQQPALEKENIRILVNSKP